MYVYIYTYLIPLNCKHWITFIFFYLYTHAYFSLFLFSPSLSSINFSMTFFPNDCFLNFYLTTPINLHVSPSLTLSTFPSRSLSALTPWIVFLFFLKLTFFLFSYFGNSQEKVLKTSRKFHDFHTIFIIIKICFPCFHRLELSKNFGLLQ